MSRDRTWFAALLIGAACACGAPQPEFHGTTYDETKPAEDFTLTDQHGRPFRLSDHRGKIVLLFFGYAYCPDVCPVTLSSWRRVEEALGNSEDIEFVFVTVDPERDTPERLREHLANFSDGFHGLTGSQEELEAVYESYGIFMRKVPFSSSAVGYVVDHSTVIIVLDRKGQMRLTIPFDADPDEIVHDVRRLLDS